MVIDKSLSQKAAKYLAEHDTVLAKVIKEAGPCTLRPQKDHYWILARSIIGQQLSMQAADTIEKRLRGLFNGRFPSPDKLLEKDIDALRQVGLSKQKATYVRDLARHIVEKKVRLHGMGRLDNEEIIEMLTAVKGVGTWTAHMFLMFGLARSDVLATGDLGLRTSLKKLYKLHSLPTPEKIQEIATKHQWHPYETIACWYVWASLDKKPI